MFILILRINLEQLTTISMNIININEPLNTKDKKGEANNFTFFDNEQVQVL